MGLDMHIKGEYKEQNNYNFQKGDEYHKKTCVGELFAVYEVVMRYSGELV